MLMASLTAIAVILTATMFATRNSMLGFPSAIFWVLLGGYAYTLSTVPWGDIYFFFAFTCLLGMTTFCALGAFALREKRDAYGESELDDKDEGEEGYFDEVQEPDVSGEMGSATRRRKALHNRAANRRGGGKKKKQGKREDDGDFGAMG